MKRTIRWGLIGATTNSREWMIAAISGEGAPAASGEDGVRAMASALAVLESARTRRETNIDPGL